MISLNLNGTEEEAEEKEDGVIFEQGGNGEEEGEIILTPA